jgi:hypothetical protein
MLVLYDNAGESFNPGADTTGSPVTRHVAHSGAILFLFDPTKDVDFRRRLTSADPQLKNADIRRQTVNLNEIAARIKNMTNLKPGQRHGKPLIVVVAKYDIWRDLLREPPETLPVYRDADGIRRLDRGALDSASLAVREMLREVCPDLIAAAESGWSFVRYLPASATGCSPIADPATGALGFRPADLRPVWAEVPLLLFMANQWEGGLLPVGTPDGREPPLRVSAKAAGRLLLADLPGHDAPLEVPADCAGMALVDPATGKRFLLAP